MIGEPSDEGVRIVAVTQATRDRFAAYAAAHGAEHDDSYTVAEDLASFSPDREVAALAFATAQPGASDEVPAGETECVGAVALMLDGFRDEGLARFRILHAERPDAYARLVDWALGRVAPDVRHVFLFLPDGSPTAGYLGPLGFAPTRYAVILERPAAEPVGPAEPPPGVRIRQAGEADAAAWAAVANAAFGGQPGRYDLTPEHAAELLGDLRRLPHGAFVAWRDAEPVGIVAVWRDDAAGAAAAEVVTLGVVPDEQHRGLGRALLRTALAAAVEAGFPTVALSTGSTNEPALGLYTSEGFEVAEKRVCWGLDL